MIHGLENCFPFSLIFCTRGHLIDHLSTYVDKRGHLIDHISISSCPRNFWTTPWSKRENIWKWLQLQSEHYGHFLMIGINTTNYRLFTKITFSTSVTVSVLLWRHSHRLCHRWHHQDFVDIPYASVGTPKTCKYETK